MKTKVLLVYPKIPTTYWNFEHALKFMGYKSVMPPLGLITIASLLSDQYDVKLVDMNIEELGREDVFEADLVFLSAMLVQKESFSHVVRLCNEAGTPVVAGGPYPTTSHDSIEGVDYFVLNEGEVTLPRFIADYEKGVPQRIYEDETKPDITASPVPRFDLLKINSYSTMAVQTSRGCPYNCEFCDIIEMFGRTPRYKNQAQFLAELEALRGMGYRGPLFIVDDNFIGNKKQVRELLHPLIAWQKERGYPFSLFTEASVNLAGDEELMDLMVLAGFTTVFLGIETPDVDSLKNSHKEQNLKSDLLVSVEKIQRKGLEVQGGFILGFDNEQENIFDRQISFIQKAGIPVSMVGILVALPHTRLYRRLEQEGRITGDTFGNNTHVLGTNFQTTMPEDRLKNGYLKVISEIYEPKNYFTRCYRLIRRLPRKMDKSKTIRFAYIKAFIHSLIRQTFSPYGLHYLSYLGKSLVRNPFQFNTAVNLAIKGYHFIKITNDIISRNEFSNFIKRSEEQLEIMLKNLYRDGGSYAADTMHRYSRRFIRACRTRYRRLSAAIRKHESEALRNFEYNCRYLTAQYTDRAREVRQN